jgi:hypothetical protein
MSGAERRERVDDVVDGLVRAEQTEGGQDGTALQAEARLGLVGVAAVLSGAPWGIIVSLRGSMP